MEKVNGLRTTTVEGVKVVSVDDLRRQANVAADGLAIAGLAGALPVEEAVGSVNAYVALDNLLSTL